MSANSKKNKVQKYARASPAQPLPKGPHLAGTEPVGTGNERVESQPCTNPGNENAGYPKKESTLIEKWQVALSAIMVVITGGGVIVFWFQLGAMRDATNAAAVATDHADNATRIDERAWMYVEPGAATYDIGKSITASATTINIGKTPAQNIVAFLAYAVTSSGTSGPSLTGADDYTRKMGQAAFLPPNKALTMSVSGLEKPVTRDVFTKIKSGDATLFMYGRIEYTDIFKVTHHTEFCVKLEATSEAWIQWNQGNGCDENND